MVKISNMKRALTILFALAAVACSKTDVTFDDTQSNEIALMPASGNITKAAITDGVFPTNNHIALYAYHSTQVNAASNGQTLTYTDYAKFDKQYFNGQEFYCKDNQQAIWSGLPAQYWPATGSMVFAGYSLEPTVGKTNNEAFVRNGTATYTLSTDMFTLTDYTQSNVTSNTYDLLYFGRTDKSYSKNSTSVPVVFKHALSWIEIKVKGNAGSLVDGRVWAITNVEFREVQTKGNFTYNGLAAGTAEAPKAYWNSWSEAKNIVVFNEDTTTDPKTSNPIRPRQSLTNSATIIENVSHGTLVIPQTAKKLYVTVKYQSPANVAITEVIEVNIPSVTSAWESGKKYIYELTFSPQEILIAPTVEVWPDKAPGLVEEYFDLK